MQILNKSRVCRVQPPVKPSQVQVCPLAVAAIAFSRCNASAMSMTSHAHNPSNIVVQAWQCGFSFQPQSPVLLWPAPTTFHRMQSVPEFPR